MPGMPLHVIGDEALDEPVGMIIAFMLAQSERLP
jgi:hypothetical protein